MFCSMNAYETVTIVATVGWALVGLIWYLRSGGALAELGRGGTLWFDHQSDRMLEDRPSEDEKDAPIPRRELRTRF